MSLQYKFNVFTGTFDLVDISTGSTLSFETPSGIINSSNTVYTVTHTPLFIVADGGTYVVNDVNGNGGYSIVGLTVTMNNPVSQYIRSAYNA